MRDEKEEVAEFGVFDLGLLGGEVVDMISLWRMCESPWVVQMETGIGSLRENLGMRWLRNRVQCWGL
jgi:hypothetical protein